MKKETFRSLFLSLPPRHAGTGDRHDGNAGGESPLAGTQTHQPP